MVATTVPYRQHQNNTPPQQRQSERALQLAREGRRLKPADQIQTVQGTSEQETEPEDEEVEVEGKTKDGKGGRVVLTPSTGKAAAWSARLRRSVVAVARP